MADAPTRAAALDAARAAVQEAAIFLQDAALRAEGVSALTTWASPAAVAFATELAGWRTRIDTHRARVSQLDAELVDARSLVTAETGVW